MLSRLTFICLLADKFLFVPVLLFVTLFGFYNVYSQPNLGEKCLLKHLQRDIWKHQ